MQFGTFVLMNGPEWKSDKQIYDEAVEQAVLAEELGFDAIWLAEHHFSRYAILADPMMLVTYLVARTKRITIGLAVSILPFHNPLLLAEQGAIADLLSNGRFVMGIGRGYQSQEFQKLGLEIADSRERFLEIYDVLKLAWSRKEFSYNGKIFKIPPTRVYPDPLQNPYPPIAIATSGTRETMQWAAQQGLPFISGGAFPEMEGVRKRIEQYVIDAKEAGWSQDHIERCLDASPFSRRIYVASSDRDAFERPKEHVLWFHNKLMENGLPTDKKKEASYKEHMERMRTRSLQTYDDIWKQDLYATPDKMTAAIKVHQQMGIRNLVGWFNFGGMPNDMVVASMTRFSKEVMPAFKPVGARR
ncbi:MAG: LLM class flavin-dependent oxidoreductase [Chloroflexi bacterium]|nr:LLM class flavin-dependent oxidoreductase [Chloroflexota bacterium]